MRLSHLCVDGSRVVLDDRAGVADSMAIDWNTSTVPIAKLLFNGMDGRCRAGLENSGSVRCQQPRCFECSAAEGTLSIYEQ